MASRCADGRCDCCDSARREWERIQREGLKLSIQQQKMDIDMELIKAEKKRLKINSKLAQKRQVEEQKADDSSRCSRSADTEWRVKEEEYLAQLSKAQDDFKLATKEHDSAIQKLRRELDETRKSLKEALAKHDADRDEHNQTKAILAKAEEKSDIDRFALAELRRSLEETREWLESYKKQARVHANKIAANENSQSTRSSTQSGTSVKNNGASVSGGLHSIVRGDIDELFLAPISLDEGLGERESESFVIEQQWNNNGGELTGQYTGWLDSDGEPDGHGTLRIDDGSVYDGEWRHGKRQGLGVYTSIDGDLYHGFWKNDMYDGRGVYVWPDGTVHSGDYKDGIRQGNGITSWPYGAVYKGMYERDLRHGRGTYLYPDGRRYEGDYQNDRPHGIGIEFAADDKVLYDGHWQMGEFVKK